jgi:hypothetical protein
MKSYYLSEKQISNVICIIIFVTCNEIRYFLNLSTTIKIESLHYLDLGKPNMKSIEMSIQGSLSHIVES